jgi:hypothetical protein
MQVAHKCEDPPLLSQNPVPVFFSEPTKLPFSKLEGIGLTDKVSNRK